MKEIWRKTPNLWGLPFLRLLLTAAVFVNWHKKNYCRVSRKALAICRRSAVEIITVSEPTVKRRIKTVISCRFQVSCHLKILASVYSVNTEFKSAYGFKFIKWWSETACDKKMAVVYLVFLLVNRAVREFRNISIPF